MADFNHLSEAEAIREPQYRSRQIEISGVCYFLQYQYHQAACLLEDEHVYNVGFLCKRDGTNEMYRKIHITNEVFHWGITGAIQTFDTDCGKIGIVICYDVPELSRLMADQGMNILFVP
jgi:predicted amidohydrolase